ncbi:MAG: alpha/beta hydrolase [Actinomycetes bacterium]
MLLTSSVYPSTDHPDPLLLIHGMGSAATAWKPIIAQLNEHFSVITIDLPGHGETPMDTSQPMDPKGLAITVLETMHELGFDRFDVVGNSLGGWISLEIAAMKPAAIKSVTGLAPAGLWLEPFTARYPGTAIARMLASSLKVVSPLLMHYEWARKIGFENVSPLWRNFSYEICKDASDAMGKSAGYYPAWDAMLKKRFDSRVDVSIPVTVIFGDSDNTLPAATCQERSLLPDHSRWIILPDSGHAPMWDHPNEVVAEILRTTGKVS